MKNCTIKGPALLLSETASVVVLKNWTAKVTNLSIYLSKVDNNKQLKEITSLKCDPIKLTLYSTRLMSIAE